MSNKYEVVALAMNSFGHLLGEGEIVDCVTFAERIADVYSIENPKTNYVYMGLKNELSGNWQKLHGKVRYAVLINDMA